MSTNRTKTLLVYTLTQKKQDEVATLNLLLQSIDNAWVELLIQEAHQDRVSTYMLSTYAPSLRGIQVEQHMTFSLYVKDHWYIFAGGIWQVSWSQSKKGLDLYRLCSSDIDLVEIEQLPLTPEEERVELATKYAYSTIVKHDHLERLFHGTTKEESTYKKIEVVSCEEVDRGTFGERLARGTAHVLPEQAWVITFLWYHEEEAIARDHSILVAYYPTLPPYKCFHLTKTDGTLSVGDSYIF